MTNSIAPFLLEGHPLTEAQKSALQTDSAIVVEACAGSGKTTMLVNRYLSLLWHDESLSVHNILAITFTKKAAGEMLSRIREKVQDIPETTDRLRQFKAKMQRSLGQAMVMTIHGFCHQIVAAFPLALGVEPNMSILEPDLAELTCHRAILSTLAQCQDTLNESLATLCVHWSMDQMVTLLKLCFKSRETAESWFARYQTDHTDSIDPTLRDLLGHLGVLFDQAQRRYHQIKLQKGMIDYDDLLVLGRQALEKNPEIRDHYAQSLTHVLVDEFQDTDSFQWAMIQKLVEEPVPLNSPKLFLVADRFQCIYSFRGTDPTLFQDIIKQASSSTAQMVTANDNFRSHPKLIQFFNPFFAQLFKPDGGADFHNLMAKRPGAKGGILEFAIFSEDAAPTLSEQAEFIANWIRKMCDTHGYSFKDFAILLRRKKEMLSLKSALVKQGIPAHIYAGTGLFKQQEVLDMVNLTKALTVPTDDLSWVGVLRSPLFGISDDALYRLEMRFPDRPMVEKLTALTDSDLELWAKEGLCDTDRNVLSEAKTHIPEWVALVKILPLPAMLDHVLEKTCAWSSYASQSEQAAPNIQKYLRQIKTWTLMNGTTWKDIPELLDRHLHTDLAAEDNVTSPDEDALNLLTIHAAKGLEFPMLILPELHRSFNFSYGSHIIFSREKGIGLSYSQDGVQNSLRQAVLKAQKQETIEEEKRLFYVACTRARDGILFLGQERKRHSPSAQSFLLDAAVQDRDRREITFHLESGNQSYLLYTSTSDIPTPDRQQDPDSKITAPNFMALTRQTRHPSPIRLSCSDVVSALSCPKRYRLRAQIQAYDVLHSPETQLQRSIGDLVHTVFSRIILDKPSADAIADFVPALWRQEIPSCQADTIETVITQAQQFLQSPLFDNIQRAETVRNETPFSLKLDHLLIMGRMDLLLRTPGQTQIIDFKTTSGTEVLESHRIQLMVYALAVQQIAGPAPSTVGHIYFTKTGSQKEVILTADALAQFKEKLSELPKTLYEDAFTPPSKQTCKACPIFRYHTDCPREACDPASL